ncbi:MAG: MFS transporter, partial [Rhodobacterales bacterium 17-64-5]
MATRYLPLALTYSPTPRIEHFALLAGLDAAIRGILISTMPLVVYDALGDAQTTSVTYFLAGIVALVWGLLVPWATRKVPRRWAYTGGIGLYLIGNTLGAIGTVWTVPLALMCNAMATVTIFVCLNAYVLDYVDRASRGRSQSSQMAYSASAWMIGPKAG